MSSIVVAGHICLDITPVFFNGNSIPIEQVLCPGSLIEMQGVNVAVGGAVSNTGLALKLLGSDVSLMGLVGKDDFGRLVRERYAAFGLGEGLQETDAAGTSYSVVLAVPGNDRIFLHDPGTNNLFTPDMLDYSIIAQASLFHFGYPPLMQRLYENQGEALVGMCKKVQGLGVRTALDMAAVDTNSPAGKANWEKILASTLPYVDYFVPSIDEIGFMLGYSLTGNPVEDSARLGKKLLAMGAKTVLIKCGQYGMRLLTAELSLFQPCYTPRRVRSATGAGDTAIAAFLKAITENASPQKAIALAAATGACCVEEYDAISGLLPFPQLEKRFDIPE